MAVGQRIVFAPGAANMSESAFRIVLTHELFHYAARADTAAGRAAMADRRGRRFRRPAEHPGARRGRALRHPPLPSDAELDTPGPQRSLAYDRAWWFARFVADTYGTPKLRAFYLAACGVGHADLLTAVRDVLGTDSAGLLARWQQWMVALA